MLDYLSKASLGLPLSPLQYESVWSRRGWATLRAWPCLCPCSISGNPPISFGWFRGMRACRRLKLRSRGRTGVLGGCAVFPSGPLGTAWFPQRWVLILHTRIDRRTFRHLSQMFLGNRTALWQRLSRWQFAGRGTVSG